MPQPDTGVHAEAGSEQSSRTDPEVRRAELLQLREELEQSHRYSYTGHIGALTDAVLEIQDQGRETNQRLSRVESDLAEVKTDLTEVKTDLRRVDKQLGLVIDEVRTTGARVERLVGYIIRDEQGDPEARTAVTG